MDIRNLRSAVELRALLEERKPRRIQVGVTDLDGVLRGRMVRTERVLSALETGMGLCDLYLGSDLDDQPYAGLRTSGRVAGFPDAPIKVLPETLRELPEDRGLLILGEFAGRAESLCPRSALRRVVQHLAQTGFSAKVGFEYEFTLFETTDDGELELEPISLGQQGYSLADADVHAELVDALWDHCEALDLPLESLHPESGSGVLEAALAADAPVAAADKAALFKTFVKSFARKRGLVASFMARWTLDQPGQSGHIHISLQDQDGRPAFFDKGAPFRMSRTMRAFVAGQQRYLPELLALAAPTVNSYARLQPSERVPAAATWGVENRSTALRVIPGAPKAQRVEFRIAGSDANPYLALSAALASGSVGISESLMLAQPVKGNAHDQDFPAEMQLPTTLGEAAEKLAACAPARKVLGDAFVEHFVISRRWEEQQFRRAVTDWELRRYLTRI